MKLVQSVLFVIFPTSRLLSAQAAPPLDQLATHLAAMTAISGYEQAMADSLIGLLPGAQRDRAGNVILTLGSGDPKILIACPMDEPGFVVGGIRPDGYLTLRRAGPSPGPLADQQYEGQRVTVFGRRGPIPGVVGVRSTHLARGRAASETPFTFDDAYVDIGADSAAQVERLGVSALAPVSRTKAPVRYGDSLLAAPGAGRRAGCAALVRAARAAEPAAGSVTIAFVVEQSFTRRGLLTVAHQLGPFNKALLLEASGGPEPAARTASPDPEWLPDFGIIGIRVRYPGTQVETVSFEEAARIERKLRATIGGVE